MNHPLQNLKLIARAHIASGELQQAQALLQQACADDAQDAEVWFLRGVIAGKLGEQGNAVGFYARAAELEPTSVPVYFNLASTQVALGRLNEAAESLERCLQLNSRLPDARLQVSDIYRKLGLLEKARSHLDRLLQEEPRNTRALVRYANILIPLGYLAESRGYFQSALRERPGMVMAVVGLAEVSIRQGEVGAAIELLDPYLGRPPVARAIAIVFAGICHYEGRCEEAINLLEQLLEGGEVPTGDRRDILFALGRLYDKSSDYPRAFACYSEANRLKGVKANMVELEQQTDAFITLWDRQFHARLPSAEVQFGGIQPVFIVGMPRSGTSLAEQILASHPMVHGAGELKDIGNFMLQIAGIIGVDVPYPGCLQYLSRDTLNALSANYLDRLAALSGGNCSMVTDKMPVNFWNLGLIRLLFPAARIIHCTRNPLDTCLSCYFTDFAEENYHTFDLADIGHYYRQYQKIMRHWKESIQIPMLDIQYEELVSDQETVTRRLISYCGLEWDEQCLSPHQTRRDVVTASVTQVREAVYTSSVERWKNYNQYIEPLRTALGK